MVGNIKDFINDQKSEMMCYIERTVECVTVCRCEQKVNVKCI